MLMVLFVLVLVFIIVSFFGYGVHWALHQPWTKQFNESHMAHHLKLYPPSDYLSEDKYRGAGKDNTFFAFAIASLPMLGIPVLLWYFGMFSLPLALLVIAEMLFIGFLHDYIHDAFHVKNHWLNRLKIVQKWNQIHFVHHVDMGKNFGIFTFWVDKLFGTFQKHL